jgi:hypothetical protein
MNLLYLFTFPLIVKEFFSDAFTLNDEVKLQADLMSGYKNRLRPGTNRSVPVNVSVAFHLSYIKEFNEHKGKFSVNGVFYLEWYDDRLQWDPASYNGTDHTMLPQNQIWLPNFVNTNPYRKVSGLGSDLMTVAIKASGLCTWIPVQTFDVICDADVTKYPFDTQYCKLKFILWDHTIEDVSVSVSMPEVGLSLYEVHGLWDIQKTHLYSQTTIHKDNEIIVGFWLNRRSRYYTVSLIIPLLSISMLMSFVFLLPPGSGERVGFITTVLLSYIVFLTIIQDKLPESSEPSISVIGYFLLVCVLNGTITTVCVIVSLRFHTCPSNNDSIPPYLVWLARCTSKAKVKPHETDIPDSKSVSLTEDEDFSITWSDVGDGFDKLCLTVCAIQCVVGAMVYLGIVCV